MNERLINQMTAAHRQTKLRLRRYSVYRLGFWLMMILAFALLVKICAVVPARAGTSAGAEGALSDSDGCSPVAVDLRAFCVHMIAERGHPGNAREIAAAIIEQGLPHINAPADEAVCLLLAMIDVESDFRININGRAGECGLMQWKPCYYAKYAPGDDYYDPATNIYVGTLVLSHRLGSTDDMWLAVQRYNSPYAKRVGKYARKVRRDYNIYRLQLRDWEPPEWMTRL